MQGDRSARTLGGGAFIGGIGVVLMYREARVCFARAVRVGEVVFEGEMDLSVELEHGWLTLALAGDEDRRRVSLPTDSVEWVLWKGPERYGPTVSRGGI